MWGPGLAAVIAVSSETTPPGSGDQLVIILGGLLGAAITALGGIVVAGMNARAGRTEQAPPARTASLDAAGLHEDVAVLRYRADDNDERDDVQDRRLDQIERHLDIDNPRWRTP